MILDIDKIEKQLDYNTAVYNMIHKFIYDKLFTYNPSISIIGYFVTSKTQIPFRIPIKLKLDYVDDDWDQIVEILWETALRKDKNHDIKSINDYLSFMRPDRIVKIDFEEFN